jgi:predicted esterase
MYCKWLLFSCALSYAMGARAADAPTPAVGLQSDVVFSEYSPLARGETLAARLLSPLTVEKMFGRAEHPRRRLAEQLIELANEKFTFFVPSQLPPQGYALLVFVSPSETAMVPTSWLPVLERHGMIFVSASKSGNTQGVFDRRVPLALLAAHNLLQRYPIDKNRVYIGGMSGGSRVSLRVALAYPDVFHGALLHSGSDRIGSAEEPLPTAELFRQFQESSRFVYLTGQNDPFVLAKDEESRASLQEWCVFDIHVEPLPFVGHELAGSKKFDSALSALDAHEAPNPNKLAACRARRQGELTAKLQLAEQMIGRGESKDAGALLDKIDTSFGGLAAPTSLALAHKIDPDP